MHILYMYAYVCVYVCIQIVLLSLVSVRGESATLQ